MYKNEEVILAEGRERMAGGEKGEWKRGWNHEMNITT